MSGPADTVLLQEGATLSLPGLHLVLGAQEGQGAPGAHRPHHCHPVQQCGQLLQGPEHDRPGPGWWPSGSRWPKEVVIGPGESLSRVLETISSLGIRSSASWLVSPAGTSFLWAVAWMWGEGLFLPQTSLACPQKARRRCYSCLHCTSLLSRTGCRRQCSQPGGQGASQHLRPQWPEPGGRSGRTVGLTALPSGWTLLITENPAGFSRGAPALRAASPFAQVSSKLVSLCEVSWPSVRSFPVQEGVQCAAQRPSCPTLSIRGIIWEALLGREGTVPGGDLPEGLQEAGTEGSRSTGAPQRAGGPSAWKKGVAPAS